MRPGVQLTNKLLTPEKSGNTAVTDEGISALILARSAVDGALRSLLVETSEHTRSTVYEYNIPEASAVAVHVVVAMLVIPVHPVTDPLPPEAKSTFQETKEHPIPIGFAVQVNT
jgi:hypothetical protein